MNSPEDSVRFTVPTPSCPPSFDNSGVVAKDLDSWEELVLRMAFVRSSIPTASAQPISHPPDFQFGRRCHARYLSPRTIPMPIVELASENLGHQ